MYIYLGYNFTPRNVETLDEEIITTHRVIEAMKWSFAKPSILTDPDYLEITSNHSNSTGKLNKSSRRQKSLEVRLRACLYDPGVAGCPGCPRRVSSRVYIISVHRDVPGDRDVSISLKKVWKS